MKMLKSQVLLLSLVLSLFFVQAAGAQTGTPAPANETGTIEANSNAPDVEMADQLRRDGKIYIVVGCVLVVLAGMVFYLISIDKKVSRLEKEYKS